MFDDKVVDLWARSERTGPLPSLEACWHARQEGMLAPYRDQIDLSDVVGAGASVVMIRRSGRGRARIVGSGSQVQTRAGRRLVGADLHDVFAPACGASLTEVLGALFDAPALVTLEIERPELAQRAPVRLTFLPLRGEDGRVSFAMAELAPGGAVCRPGARPVFTVARVAPIDGRDHEAHRLVV